MMTQMVSRKDQILAVHRMLLSDAVEETREEGKRSEDDDPSEYGCPLVVEEQLDAEVGHLKQMDAANLVDFHRNSGRRSLLRAIHINTATIISIIQGRPAINYSSKTCSEFACS